MILKVITLILKYQTIFKQESIVFYCNWGRRITPLFFKRYELLSKLKITIVYVKSLGSFFTRAIKTS